MNTSESYTNCKKQRSMQWRRASSTGLSSWKLLREISGRSTWMDVSGNSLVICVSSIFHSLVQEREDQKQRLKWWFLISVKVLGIKEDDEKEELFDVSSSPIIKSIQAHNGTIPWTKYNITILSTPWFTASFKITAIVIVNWMYTVHALICVLACMCLELHLHYAWC